MANKFLKTLASAFIVENENNNDEAMQMNSNRQPTQVSVNATIQPQTTIMQPEVKNENVNETVAEVNKTVNVPQLNTQLLDKLCERLEAENLPGPDYMELKTAVMDPDMVNIIPDERQRLMASYRSLKANSKDLTKQRILDSIDHYASKLNEWQKEAIDGLNSERNKVSGKKQQVETLRTKIAELQQQIDELNKDVLATESKCNQNESDMKTAVGFLINKLTEDKNKITTILTD